MKKLAPLLTSIVLVYMSWVVLVQNPMGIRGIILLLLMVIVWLVPYFAKPSFIDGRSALILALIYHVARLAMILVTMYFLYTNKVLNLYEILIGYFILLLISLLSIKNERNFRS